MSYMKDLMIKKLNKERENDIEDFIKNLLAEENLMIEDYLNR